MIHSSIKKHRGTPKVIPDRESYHFNAECPLFMNTGYLFTTPTFYCKPTRGILNHFSGDDARFSSLATWGKPGTHFF